VSEIAAIAQVSLSFPKSVWVYASRREEGTAHEAQTVRPSKENHRPSYI
jgi:hypothetical protein